MDTSQRDGRPDDGRDLPARERPAVPRWVKIFGLIALAVVIIFAILMLLGVEHGPGLHSAAAVASVVLPSALQGSPT